MGVLLRAVEDVDVSSPDDAAAGAPIRALTKGSGDTSERAVIAGRYELCSRIGRGATGSVYRARDRMLDRQVAIKLLEPGQLVMAEREAQILAKISHRNVVTIHDLGQDQGLRYLVLELLEGRNFREWLRERPDPKLIVRHFLAAGRGLAAAHQAGLLHRDFKPSNVLLTREGRVVVLDFGLARSVDAVAMDVELGQFTEGTLAYMAPERLAGHDYDERSDQFSFCVALWEALANTSPFTGADPLARYRSIRKGPTNAPGSVPRQVLGALRRGLEFEREHRFSTMHELLRELGRTDARARKGPLRPVLMSAAAAATFAFAWGLLPDTTAQDAYSSLDPRADAALVMLESARKRAVDGDTRTALNDLMHARELATVVDQRDEAYCTFGMTVPDVADAMARAGGVNEARMAYAIALRWAQDCPNIDRKELLARRESARQTFAALDDIEPSPAAAMCEPTSATPLED